MERGTGIATGAELALVGQPRAFVLQCAVSAAACPRASFRRRQFDELSRFGRARVEALRTATFGIVDSRDSWDPGPDGAGRFLGTGTLTTPGAWPDEPRGEELTRWEMAVEHLKLNVALERGDPAEFQRASGVLGNIRGRLGKPAGLRRVRFGDRPAHLRAQHTLLQRSDTGAEFLTVAWGRSTLRQQGIHGAAKSRLAKQEFVEHWDQELVIVRGVLRSESEGERDEIRSLVDVGEITPEFAGALRSALEQLRSPTSATPSLRSSNVLARAKAIEWASRPGVAQRPSDATVRGWVRRVRAATRRKTHS